MKFTSIFYAASAKYIRAAAQIQQQASEKYEVYFNIFCSERKVYSRDSANIQPFLISSKISTNICKQFLSKRKKRDLASITTDEAERFC